MTRHDVLIVQINQRNLHFAWVYVHGELPSTQMKGLLLHQEIPYMMGSSSHL